MKVSQLIICFWAVIAMASCNNLDKRAAGWRDFYKDSVFIQIPGKNVHEIFELHVSIPLGDGNRRLMRTRYMSGDTLCLGVPCGADVRVSENIYEYMTWITRRDNEKLKTGTDYEIRLYLPDSSYIVVRKELPEDCWLQKISGPVMGVGEAPKR